MQDQSIDAFMHTLECAKGFNMPKLMACCEHHICADPLQRFQPLSARLGDALPPSAVTRIADCLQVAIQKMAARLVAVQGFSAHYCCKDLVAAFVNVPRSGNPSSENFARGMLGKYAPSPKDFLEMTQQ